MDSSPGDKGPPNNPVVTFFRRLNITYQTLLDKSTPHLPLRWTFTLLLTVFYFIRVYFLQGWYIVTYALGIYLLNLFIGFLTPKIEPIAGGTDSDVFVAQFHDLVLFALNVNPDEGPQLPTRTSDEFRPFMRRLPEFKFWYSGTKAVVIATICTFFDALNIPVFWPILVMYFIILFVITMKRQLKHMIKHRYVPWSHGKAKYQGKADTGKVVSS